MPIDGAGEVGQAVIKHAADLVVVGAVIIK